MESTPRLPGLDAFKERLLAERDAGRPGQPDHPESTALAMGWMCVEVGARADSEDGAVEAMVAMGEHLSMYARFIGNHELDLMSLFPFASKTEEVFARALRGGLQRTRQLPDVPQRPSGAVPDIEVSYSPTPQTPFGYARILAMRPGHEPFLDRTLDPVELPRFIERLTAGDPELVDSSTPRVFGKPKTIH